MKEYEFSFKLVVLVGFNVIDIYNLGNVFFDCFLGQIWIVYIGSDEVFFSMSYFFDLDDEEEEEDSSFFMFGINGYVLCLFVIDIYKLFYV